MPASLAGLLGFAYVVEGYPRQAETSTSQGLTMRQACDVTSSTRELCSKTTAPAANATPEPAAVAPAAAPAVKTQLLKLPGSLQRLMKQNG
jgi:hypothetical protein